MGESDRCREKRRNRREEMMMTERRKGEWGEKEKKIKEKENKLYFLKTVSAAFRDRILWIINLWWN